MSGTTHTLKHPIRFHDGDGKLLETITSVTVQRPLGKHMKSMDSAKGKTAQMLALLAACTGLLPVQVDLMDGEDVTEIGAIIAGFLGQSLKTGET
jgi:hypothetical protein